MGLPEVYAAIVAETRETYAGARRHSGGDAMSTSEQRSGQRASGTTEEELRAAYEAQIKQIRVEQVLLENVVTLVNLGMRRTGLAPGTEEERDPGAGAAGDRGGPSAAAAARAGRSGSRSRRSATRSPSSSWRS